MHRSYGLPRDGSLDADIRFVARTDVDDVTEQIVVSGRASAPRITVESVPDLPQDEILARILFGRRANSLTAFESVRLARSAAKLAGLSVGPDVLGGVRKALRLDVVDIERQGDGAESSVLNLGTRIRDRVSVGVQHGLQAGSGRVTVQIELTPNVSGCYVLHNAIQFCLVTHSSEIDHGRGINDPDGSYR